MKYFLDSYALVEIFEMNPLYQTYLNQDCVTLKDNLAETYHFLLKKYGRNAADDSLRRFEYLAKDLPTSVIRKAMIFKKQNIKSNFSYIKCFGYSYAIETQRVFVTGDRGFQGFENVEIVT